MEKETRVLIIPELRVKVDEVTKKPMMTGYASIFNSLSEDLGFFREKIEPGAFKEAIKVSDTRALFNHDPNYVLGRQSNGTLRLSEDKKGLYMEVDYPDTQFIRDLVIAPIERGDVQEQSFAFTVASDKWEGLEEKDPKEMPIRTILKVAELFDVSPVTYPAYPDTAVGIRSLEAAKENIGAPPFTLLTMPELLRNYADEWQEITDSGDEDKASQHVTLRERIMEELNERFNSVVEPTQDADSSSGEPTQAQTLTGKPTQAEPEAMERLDKLIKRFEKLKLGE